MPPQQQPKPAGKRNHTGHRVGAWHQNARHTDETVRKARELRARGKTYGQISQALGVNARTVADWVRHVTRYPTGGTA